MTSSGSRSLLRDALIIAIAGIVLALAANALSPRGLSLRRDYFPAVPKTNAPAATAPTTGAKSGPAIVAAGGPTRTKRGLPLATHEEVVALFHDPRYAEGRILFVDARDDEHYGAGHIPGAYPFDHYHPDRYMAAILGAAVLAERIVVYCNGGDCEDSELATLDLIALGIPDSKLAIYGGGITAWNEHKLPVERGARGSGATTSP